MLKLTHARFVNALSIVVLSICFSACSSSNSSVPNQVIYSPINGLTITQEVAEDGTEVLGFNFNSSEAQEYLAEHKGEIAKELAFTANDMEILEDILSNIREVNFEITALEAEYRASNPIIAQQYCNPNLYVQVTATAAYGVTSDASASGCAGLVSIVKGYTSNALYFNEYYKCQAGQYVEGVVQIGAGARCQGWAMAAVGRTFKDDYKYCSY